MNRRGFLKLLGAAITVPFAKVKSTEKEIVCVTTTSFTNDAAGFRAKWGLPPLHDSRPMKSPHSDEPGIYWSSNFPVDVTEEFLSYNGFPLQYTDIDKNECKDYGIILGIAMQNAKASNPVPVLMDTTSCIFKEVREDAVIMFTNGIFNFVLRRDVFAGELVMISDLVN